MMLIIFYSSAERKQTRNQTEKAVLRSSATTAKAASTLSSSRSIGDCISPGYPVVTASSTGAAIAIFDLAARRVAERRSQMEIKRSGSRNPFADIAPALGDYNDRVLLTRGRGRGCRRVTVTSLGQAGELHVMTQPEPRGCAA
jgi:hypothetical protein